MSHNKMYREIVGYEDSMYTASEIIDEVDDLIHSLRYGEPYPGILEQVKKIKELVNMIETAVYEGKGKKIDS